MVAYEVPVLDCRLAEQKIHERLSAYRVRDKREFFSLPLKDAIKIVQEIVESASLAYSVSAIKTIGATEVKLEAPLSKFGYFSPFISPGLQQVVCQDGHLGFNRINLLSLETGKLSCKLSRNRWEIVLCVAFSPDGQILASGSRDSSISLWRVADGALLQNVRYSSQVWSLAYSPDGNTLASGSKDGTIQFWRIGDKNGKMFKIFQAHKTAVERLAFSHDGTVVASGSWIGPFRLWNVDGSLIDEIGPQTDGTKLRFSPCKNNLVIDASLYLWHHDGIKKLCDLKELDCDLPVSFSPDGKVIAGFSRRSEIGFWQVPDGGWIMGIEVAEEPKDLAFSDDGRVLAVLFGDRARSYNLAIYHNAGNDAYSL